MSPTTSPESPARAAAKSSYGLIAGLVLAVLLVPAILWIRGASLESPPSTSAEPIKPTEPVSAVALPPANLAGDKQFLDDRDAFKVSASTRPNGQVQITFLVADGYYLYRHKIDLQTTQPIALTNIAIPPGEQHRDPYFGQSMVLRKQFAVTAGVVGAVDSHDMRLRLTYQGCADDGICYPPIQRVLTLDKPV